MASEPAAQQLLAAAKTRYAAAAAALSTKMGQTLNYSPTISLDFDAGLVNVRQYDALSAALEQINARTAALP